MDNCLCSFLWGYLFDRAVRDNFGKALGYLLLKCLLNNNIVITLGKYYFCPEREHLFFAPAVAAEWQFRVVEFIAILWVFIEGELHSF